MRRWSENNIASEHLDKNFIGDDENSAPNASILSNTSSFEFN